jgi:inositol-1,3,4-trisphosphate 5/6-kinase/inositol-tetrakisphosphate 1-kinase
VTQRDHMNKSIKIGYYMTEKKQKQIQWSSFMTFAKQRGAELIPLSLLEPIRDDIDVLVLKLTDDLVRPSDPVCVQRVQTAQNYIRTHSHVKVFDPIESQRLTVDRLSLAKLFEYLSTHVAGVQCARSVLVDTQCTDVVAALPSGFTFPAICKSVQASGDARAHQMVIVWSVDDIASFQRPYILQEYINHNATVFKLYVIGSEFHVVRRPSFPNLPSTPRPPISFNSQDTKMTLPPVLQTDYAATQPPPTNDILQTITRVIGEFFRLTLFGYDVVVNIATQKLAVIDVNYFPDYKGVDNVYEKLFNHFTAGLRDNK